MVLASRQYCSYGSTDSLKQNNILLSITEQYDPYENAVAERVNGILKDEFGFDGLFIDRSDLARELH